MFITWLYGVITDGALACWEPCGERFRVPDLEALLAAYRRHRDKPVKMGSMQRQFNLWGVRMNRDGTYRCAHLRRGDAARAREASRKRPREEEPLPTQHLVDALVDVWVPPAERERTELLDAQWLASSDPQWLEQENRRLRGELAAQVAEAQRLWADNARLRKFRRLNEAELERLREENRQQRAALESAQKDLRRLEADNRALLAARRDQEGFIKGLMHDNGKLVFYQRLTLRDNERLWQELQAARGAPCP